MTEITFNPSGAVCIADGGTPRIITIKAATNISGGMWVTGSGACGAATVGASADSYVASDIVGWAQTAAVTSSGVIGMALNDIASGTYGACAQRGIFLVPVGSTTILGSVVKGCPVASYGLGGVIGSSTLSFNCYIGKALTDGGTASTSDFVAVALNI